ncbi:hypothetical protein [Rhizobium sp. Leaf341]|uniref:hypothetical protein n=1 Tax=Rhizobium sp. Leaf341 TaxID=1736344 RepID=UPI00071620C1|nr:hypothetical protein [Rhizobium sp. Leaf341]KQR68846.1 hypothetical protein ASG03_06235 [Rhizobium sp. Leaf341]
MKCQAETTASNATAALAVRVVADRDEWNVVIVENGTERHQSFVQHDWALSYARGQRVRLGLPADPKPATA